MNKKQECLDFVMSSYARIYGVNKVKSDKKFHDIALQWCIENNYVCDIHSDDLNKVDAYFKEQYEKKFK